MKLSFAFINFLDVIFLCLRSLALWLCFSFIYMFSWHDLRAEFSHLVANDSGAGSGCNVPTVYLQK